MSVKLLALLFVLSAVNCNAYRILFVSVFNGRSHWLWLENFQRALLERGHHVTTVNNYPAKMPHENLTEIVIKPEFDIPFHFPKKTIFEMRYASDFQNVDMYLELGLLSTEHALNDGGVKQLIASEGLHFDLVIFEQFFHESLLMFAHKFKCPIITIGTFGYADNMDHAMGIITPWAIVPHLMLSYTDQMTFSQRFYNTYLSLYDILCRNWYYMPKMQAMAEKHFGKFIDGPFPHIADLHSNISMMMINSHLAIDVTRPTVPGFLNVGGAHLNGSKPLPQDLQDFLDNSTKGVVYFSLGSYIKTTDLPLTKITAILKAFGQLEQNVLWKYENESVGILPANVMIKKWLPQSDILAHRNVKLFITHGGLFGTQEGIYYGKPMLCIPLYGDQHRNARKSVRAGIARSLLLTELNEQNLLQNIKMLLHDSKYSRNAKDVSIKFRDNPMHPLDMATYWIEYVIRHNGATYLKSYGGVQMPWHQYLLLDIVAVCLFVSFITVYIVWKLLKAIWKLLNKLHKTEVKDKQKQS